MVPEVSNPFLFEGLRQRRHNLQGMAERIVHPGGDADRPAGGQFPPELPEGLPGQEIILADGMEPGGAAEGVQGGEEDQVILRVVLSEKGPGREIADRDGRVAKEIAGLPGQLPAEEREDHGMGFDRCDPLCAAVEGLGNEAAGACVEDEDALAALQGIGERAGRGVQKGPSPLPGNDGAEPVAVVEDGLPHRDLLLPGEAEPRGIAERRGREDLHQAVRAAPLGGDPGIGQMEGPAQALVFGEDRNRGADHSEDDGKAG